MALSKIYKVDKQYIGRPEGDEMAKDRSSSILRRTGNNEVAPKTTTTPLVTGNVIDGQVFTSEKDVPMTFMGTFKHCEFNLDELKNRNFFSAKFVDCKFATDFKFVYCNLGNTEGVDGVEMEGCLHPIKIKVR